MLTDRIARVAAVPMLAVFSGCGTAAPAGSDDPDVADVSPVDGERAYVGAETSPEPVSTLDESRPSIQRLIVDEAVAHGGVPPALALAIARTASNFSPRVLGVTGLVGVMQLPPDAAETGAGNALSPVVLNVRAALDELARLRGRYDDWTLALSHYRGGPLPATGDERPNRPHGYTSDFVDEVLYWERQYRRDPIIAAWIRQARGLPRFVVDDSSRQPHATRRSVWDAPGPAPDWRRGDRPPGRCLAGDRSRGTWIAVGTRRFR